MEKKPVSSSRLEWGDLASYNEKPSDNQKQICFSFSGSGFANDHPNCSSSNNPFYASTKNPMDCLGKLGSLPSYRSWWSSDSKIEKPKTYVSPLPVSSTPVKRSRPLIHNIKNPCCQVEGCNLDLKTAKDYHRRHRICEMHSKSPKVIVAGMERRFCQQCSRFHALSEFDGKKRSCRRRLFDHNARRRRVPVDSVQRPSSGVSSMFYDIIKTQPNFYMTGLGNSPSGAIGGSLCFSSNEMHNSVSKFQMDQCLNVSIPNYRRGPDLLNAPSLLSTNSWSLNDEESRTMKGFLYKYPVYTMHHTTTIDSTQAENHNVGVINFSSYTR